MDEKRIAIIEEDIEQWIRLAGELESLRAEDGESGDKELALEKQQAELKDRLYLFRPRQYVLDVLNFIWNTDKYKEDKRIEKLVWEIEHLLRPNPEHDYTFKKALESRLERATPEQLALFKVDI